MERKTLGKFDVKADNGIFLGYSLTSHAYKVYNKRLIDKCLISVIFHIEI